ncbi:hypothetical protein [Actinomadura macra]|uniref:hypothetical protein n=1 Tax=Actinomadura macra TaxID=46164 RepID=UPI0008372EBB|nr:hypothetical protein [Actinomadura macra]
MRGTLPWDVKALVGVRVLNQLGAYVLPFLAVLAGPGLASWALGVFGVAALLSRWLGGLLRRPGPGSADRGSGRRDGDSRWCIPARPARPGGDVPATAMTGVPACEEARVETTSVDTVATAVAASSAVASTVGPWSRFPSG